MQGNTERRIMTQQKRFEGKVVLVTGAANGLGAMQAQRFAEEGARAVVLADIDPAGLDKAARLVIAAGAQAEALILDVAQESAWLAAIDAIKKRFGTLHVIVNNAGISIQRTFDNCTLDEWNRTIAVNQTGVFLGIKHGARFLREQGGGAIVNISSAAGMTGYFSAAYAASKWAVRGMTKSAAMEYAAAGIRINSVHPGFIWSPMTEPVKDRVNGFLAVIPTDRIGDASEVADAVLFLASDSASYITGAELAVDGGLTAGGGLQQVAKNLGIL
jgi:3alpha(or 20beta)-hydroxysteroid dehydrogenase